MPFDFYIDSTNKHKNSTTTNKYLQLDLEWATFVKFSIQRKENSHRDTSISAKIRLGLSGGKHNKYLSILTLRGRNHIASHKKQEETSIHRWWKKISLQLTSLLNRDTKIRDSKYKRSTCANMVIWHHEMVRESWTHVL